MKQPNILILFTDQQRADSIAALGNPVIRTPYLDRLCREGTAFTRAYTPSPVCISARYALATGLPANVTGITDNSWAPAKHTSFMQRLAALGYQTHGVGKMHFSPMKEMWGFESRDFSEEGGGADDFRAYTSINTAFNTSRTRTACAANTTTSRSPRSYRPTSTTPRGLPTAASRS